MAASVYATPPPDLSGEEAALSDASNSSHTNSSHGSTLKASKRTLSSSFLNAATTTQSSTLTTASQLSSDSLPDLSKKRRKQSMPIRFSANGTAIEGPQGPAESVALQDAQENAEADQVGMPDGVSNSNPASPGGMDTDMDHDGAAAALLLEEQQNNFQKIFLSNLSQLQQKHLQLQQHSDPFLPLGNPDNFLSSKLTSLIGSRSLPLKSDDEQEPDEASSTTRPGSGNGKDELTQSDMRKENGTSHSDDNEDEEDRSRRNDRDDVGDGEDRARNSSKGASEREEQQHQQQQQQQTSGDVQTSARSNSDSALPKITMKKELFMDPEWDGEIRSNLPKPEDWISIAGLSFPFPPEAAAALSASGYLPQLPQLLGVPSVPSGFGGPPDGASRTSVPPLRIFNPEAYCDLCNKEFCNKYFLKTHKANKHGIYEPAASASNNGTSDNGPSALSAMSNPFSSIHQLSQVFQMQQQQQQQQQPHASEQLEKLSTGAGLAGQQQLVSAGSDGGQSLQLMAAQHQPGGSAPQGTGGSTKQSAQPPPPMRSTQSPKVAPSIQPTVFCDICFKKFSSLSAMRKHRSKAHELSGAGSHQLQQQLQQHHQQQLQQQQHQLQQQLQQHLAQQHQQYQQQLQAHQQQLTAGGDGNPKHDSNDGSSGNGSGAGPDQSSTGPAIQLPDGFREDYTVEQEDATFTPQPRKLSPHSMQAAREANFSADKLRRLGVTNPEAFCEICCKEYCNKYFLRTHRLKRHGILPTPDELKDERGHPWAPFMQTSPLNLIMGGSAAELVNAQMALQAASPSSLKKLLAAGELAGDGAGSGAGAIEGAKGSSAVEIKQEMQSQPSYLSAKRNGLGDQMDSGDEQAQQSDGNSGAADSGEERQRNTRDAGSDEDAEAISVDLQKLQSMIMQLNDLNSMQQQQHALHARKMSCGVCAKELPNQYLLHAHMIQEHGALTLDNNNLGPKPSGSSREATPLTSTVAGEPPVEVCRQCDKEFTSVYGLKQHLLEAHGGGLPSPKREGFVTPERPTTGPIPMPPGAPTGFGERKPAFSMTPTSSYCEICNKELCNKYFMKTHMQRMHGIEIENGAQIGGVVCNICNKELCSKYFLRVHKHNTHGIVEEGAPLPQARQNGGSGGGGGSGGAGPTGPTGGSGGNDTGAGENGDNASYAMGGDSGTSALLKPGEVSDLSNRYYSHFTEVCPLCSRRFRSAKWLRAHLLSDHGKQGVERLKDLEQRLASGSGTQNGTPGGRSKSSSPSLKVPNGLTEAKYGAKSPFAGGLSPAEAAKFLPKTGALPAGLFGPDQPNSPMGGLKGYQCSYCSFATPLLPLLFIHERSHSSLTIVQQQLLQQQQQQQQQQQDEAQASALGSGGSFAPLLQSESAVSLAKEQSEAGQLVPGTSSETPSSTPASTPVPSLSQEALNLLQRHTPIRSPVARPGSGYEEPGVGSPRPPKDNCSKPPTPKPASSPVEATSIASTSEPTAMLSEMANMTQRPAVYALPQQSGPLMMQSFLIEESLSGGARSPQDSDCRSDGPDHRFVPAVVFLPVKERILTPMTISFNLSPA